MTATRTLDLRGIGSEERDDRMLSALEGLRTGESLQVVLEQNPLLLVYTLKAGGEFDIVYLSQSLQEWRLELTRKAQPADKRERFNRQPALIELDMRRVPMLQRQSRIMEAWKELPAGGTLRLTIDREPKPLFFVFRTSQRGKFEWNYEKQGPGEWIVSIRKL